MKFKRVFFTGGSGLLALNWAISYQNSIEVILGLHTRNIRPDFAKAIHIPLDSLDELIDCLEYLRPDVIINAAAVTNIEYCEHNPVEAHLVNVCYAANIAMACQKLQISLIHISSDHLFTGLFPFTDEDAVVQPLNVYGTTKALAECEVKTHYPDSLIIRTNFYGWGTSYRHSFSDNIINALTSGVSYSAFYDVYFTPILVSDLAAAVHQLYNQQVYGVFNIVSNERLSKYEFSVLLAEIFQFPRSLVCPISIHERPGLVKRPKDMSLSNLKVQNYINNSIGSVDDGLRRLLDQQDRGFDKVLKSL